MRLRFRGEDPNPLGAKAAIVMVAAAGLLWVAAPGLAHHAFASEYDADKPVTIKGTVTKVELINPHSWIYLAAKEPDGRVVEWMFEGAAPNTLVRRGLTKNTLPIGSELVVTGYRARDGSNKVNGRDITYSDGRKLTLGSPLAPAAGARAR